MTPDDSRSVPEPEAPRPGALSERRRGYDRAVRLGLAASLAFHIVLLLVVGRSLRIDAPEPPPSTPLPIVQLQGPVALEIGRVIPASEEPEPEAMQPPPDEAEAEVQPEEPRPEPPVEGPPVVADEGQADDVDADDGFLTNAEILQPKEGDERLWPEYADDEIPEYLAENPYAAYEGEIRARLGMMLDSLNLTEEQRRRATEWLTGEEGEEWGVTQEGIYIDGMVIPIDLRSLFQEQGPRGRESRQELRDRLQIQYDDMIDEADDIREERARQMRERTKEELERRLRDSLEAAQDSASEGDG
ncbi:MAG TPA: hypothetical protein VLA33_06770 [Gemmatimonadota bacterium]|nr:hypothetical protein [Gemmatimonadota bacterium]